jgi:hypothetical protein
MVYLMPGKLRRALGTVAAFALAALLTAAGLYVIMWGAGASVN